MKLTLRYDLRAPDWGVPAADLYAACLEQCEWADQAGFDNVLLTEHHGSEDGYCPSPLVLAAAIAARTRRLRILLSALVLPLHDPVRAAEDAAVVDLISRGRLEIVVGNGYRRAEFEMFGRDLRRRPSLARDGVTVLRNAWSGEPFLHNGAWVRVTPRPQQRPGPPLYLGGASEPAARRAAQLGDGYFGTVPGFESFYEDECARLGKTPVYPAGEPSLPYLFIHVTEDPDGAWDDIGPHAVHEMNSYGTWLEDAGALGPYHTVTDVDELRATGLYHVCTPDALVTELLELGDGGRLMLHPLMGGLPPSSAARSLELIGERVLPALRDADFSC